MRKGSRLIGRLKREEEGYIKNLSPSERMNLAVSHSDFIKNLFYTGLNLKGFSKKEINRLWGQNNIHG